MYKIIEIKRAFLSFYHILKVGGLIENNNIKKDKVKKLTKKMYLMTQQNFYLMISQSGKIQLETKNNKTNRGKERIVYKLEMDEKLPATH